MENAYSSNHMGYEKKGKKKSLKAKDPVVATAFARIKAFIIEWVSESRNFMVFHSKICVEIAEPLFIALL